MSSLSLLSMASHHSNHLLLSSTSLSSSTSTGAFLPSLSSVGVLTEDMVSSFWKRFILLVIIVLLVRCIHWWHLWNFSRWFKVHVAKNRGRRFPWLTWIETENTVLVISDVLFPDLAIPVFRLRALRFSWCTTGRDDVCDVVWWWVSVVVALAISSSYEKGAWSQLASDGLDDVTATSRPLDYWLQRFPSSLSSAKAAFIVSFLFLW
jgi:hypothetical protein